MHTVEKLDEYTYKKMGVSSWNLQFLKQLPDFFYRLISYRAQFYWFLSALIFYYIFSPLMSDLSHSSTYMVLLAEIATCAVAGLGLGFFILPRLISIPPAHVFSIQARLFTGIILAVFTVFVVALVLTAQSVPLFLALKQANIQKLVESRAFFLKARTGFESGFVYINALLTSSFIPYVVVLSFANRYPIRKWAFLCSYIYSFLFLEKAFFLKVVLPLFCYLAAFIHKPNYKKYIWTVLLSIPFTVYLNTVISGFGGGVAEGQLSQAKNDVFYDAGHASSAGQSRLHFITWRIFAVPVFTAADSLKLFDVKYDRHYLHGQTSRLISGLMHQENIKFEREVFNLEWGSDSTSTASANSVYFIEQYVNFGWLGVLLSSIFVGYMYAALRSTKDAVLGSLSVLLSILLMYGALIPTLISNGFLVLFAFLYFVKLKE